MRRGTGSVVEYSACRGDELIDLDALNARTASRPSDPHPRLGGYRGTDLSASVGTVVWLGLVVAAVNGVIALTTVELFVGLALLVFIPLGLGLVATPRRSGELSIPYTLAVSGQPFTAIVAVAALALPVGTLTAVVLVIPWLGVTGTIAVFGLWRLLSRGPGPLPELAIDAAMFYLPVGAVALLLYQAGISLRFEPIIILLTAVHFHYAGFVLPIITGLAGRAIAGQEDRYRPTLGGRMAAAATLVIIINLALIAVGITFSPLVEVVAVSLFTIAVAVFALLVLRQVVPRVPRLPAVLLAIASLSIVATMVLALMYGYSAFPGNPVLITIGEMVRWHGTLNAFGFALPALLAFRIQDERRPFVPHEP